MIKTIFILRYLMNQPYRRKINNQLNKGERLFANLGFKREQRLDFFDKIDGQVETENTFFVGKGDML